MAYDFLKHYDVKKVGEFLETREKKVLVFDTDSDGVCSAVLISKAFPGFGIIPKRGPKIPPEFLSQLASTKAGLFVFLDMAVDHERKQLKQLKRALPRARIIIIDHHIPEKDMNSRDTIHVNPMLFADVYLPTSYLTYRLMKALEPRIRPYVWIAAMGTLADHAMKHVEDVYRDCRQLYPQLMKNRQRRLVRGIQMLESLITAQGNKGAEKDYAFLLKAEAFEDFERRRELEKSWRAVKKEFERVIRQAQRERKKEGSVMLFEIRTTQSLTSPAANHFARRYPAATVVVRRKSEAGWSVSVRNQAGRVNVAAVVKKAARGIGSGGGHKKAAGAQVRDWDVFRKRFLLGVQRGK